MAKNDYWKKRFEELESKQHDKSVEMAKQIQEQYDRSQSIIENRINSWYQRIADNNGVSMQKARELLDKKELREFKWSLEDYIKFGEENAVDQRWMKELENASAKYHIGRLEALKIQTSAEIEKLMHEYDSELKNHLKETYMDSRNRTAYEIFKGFNTGVSLGSISAENLETIIQKPWAVDGRDFSSRIWTDKTRLINMLYNNLTNMCITGDSVDTVIRQFAKDMGVSKNQAARVILTESAAFASRASHDCMNELDVEEYQVLETLDSKTCSNCGDMDLKHFSMRDYVVGVTAPPFHPRCRGTTCPYLENEETDYIGERAARGEDGKTYYVPEDMSYEEWKKSFVDGNKADLQEVVPDIKFATKHNSTITSKQRFKDTITVSDAHSALPIRVKQALNDVTYEFGYDGSACDIMNKIIRVGIGASKEDVFHEIGHLVENYMMNSADVRKYKEFLVDGLSINDIIEETYYNSVGDPINIFLLGGSRFESEYQSRLYVLDTEEALNTDGTINVDYLEEVISEAFRKYMLGETISDEILKIIEGSVL